MTHEKNCLNGQIVPQSNTSAHDTSIQKFEFQNTAEIRVNIINGEPWFVAQDVCRTLSIQNNGDTMLRIDDDEKLMSAVPTLGQNRQMWHVSESGLYALIFQSRKPIARTFRKWVTSEVLPAIRKTGSYQAPLGNCRQMTKQEIKEQNEQQKQLNFTEQSALPMPDMLTSKPTHCLVLSCHRANGTVKHLFIHYNAHDGWFGERYNPVDMANVLSSSSSRIAQHDNETAEYAYKWYSVDAGGKYKDLGFVFCANKK